MRSMSNSGELTEFWKAQVDSSDFMLFTSSLAGWVKVSQLEFQNKEHN